jgi:hypothetical protein
MASLAIQKLVRVNAAYRSSGSTSNFTIQFQSRDLDKVRSIAVVRALLNRAFPNVYAPLNTLTLVQNLSTTVVMTIPPLQYTATTLAAAIQTASGGLLTVTYQAFPVDRFQFTYTGLAASAALTVAGSTIANLIGLTSDTVLPAVNIPINLPSAPQLQGPDCVYIQSNFVAGSHCVDVPSNGSFIPFLAAIDFTNVPYGFSAYFEAKTPKIMEIDYQKTSGSRSLVGFDIQLTDVNGNILPLPPNVFLDMHLAFYA